MADTTYDQPVAGSFIVEIKDTPQPGLWIRTTNKVDTFIHIKDGEVIFMRDMCNTYLREKGARDAYGREVIDKESGNG